LNQAWAELKQMAANRGQKLDESLIYQQFLAKVEEEEAWIRFVNFTYDQILFKHKILIVRSTNFLV